MQDAKNIRSCLRYLERFQGATAVVHIDDAIADGALGNHVRDIAFLKKAGFSVLIVAAAKTKIDEVLSHEKIAWNEKNGVRISDERAMPFIKMTAFDQAHRIMTNLASEKINAVIGNWVQAKSFGVRDGVDFKLSGEIEKLQIDAIRASLSNDFVPVFPCIGWSSRGTPYNISSVSLAEKLAIALQADKLFFLSTDVSINRNTFLLQNEIAVNESGAVPSFNLNELTFFLNANERAHFQNKESANQKNEKENCETVKREKIFRLLRAAKNACEQNVSRVHIVDAKNDGALLLEVFSDVGNGTMIYKSGYGTFRKMKASDVPRVHELMSDFVTQGKLLARSENDIFEMLDDYLVFELDDEIHACAFLHAYDKVQAELGAVAVDDFCMHIGVGERLVLELAESARRKNLQSVFVLTTSAGDWFCKLGFKPCAISSLPLERQKKWSPERASKAYRLLL